MSEEAFAQSWTQAEQTVYARLLKATGTEDKKTAFLGYLPAMADIWAFNTGPGGGSEQTLWSPSIVSVHLKASIRGVFRRREDALTFVMRVVRAQPMESVENVQCFRIRRDGFPEPKGEPMAFGNEKQLYLVFTVDIGCEIVFKTGG